MKNGTHFRNCHLCEANCGVAIEVQDGIIASVKGDDADPFSRGHICPKAVALKDLYEDPDRLRTPIRKNAQGEWEAIGWEDAYELVVQRLHAIRTEFGRNAIGAYLGNPNVHNHGSMIAMLPFLRALGTQNRFSATSNDQLPHMLASLEMFGHQALFPIPDIDHTDLFICIGGNPMASNGSLMTVADFRGRLKDLKARGGQLIVIDPRRTETAGQADEFHFIRPASDALLLMAMVHTLFDENLADLGRVGTWCKDLDLVKLASLPFSPEAVAGHTGIDAVTTRTLARRLAKTEKALIYGRLGTSTQAFGGIATWLINLLNILTGKLDNVGGVLFSQPAIDMIELGAMGGQKGHFARRFSRVKKLPEFGGEFPASTIADEILTPGEGQIRAFVTVAGNPVLSSPNGKRLDEALSKLDFMVSVDYYLNETTRHADIILPPTMALERSHYDLIFNMVAVRNIAKFSDALFTPPDSSRHDWQILLELAHRLERTRDLGWQAELGWRAFKKLGPDGLLDMGLRSGPYGSPTPLAPLLQPAVDLLSDILPKKHWIRGLLRMSALDPRWQDLPKGLSLAMLRKHPHGIELGPLQPCLPERLYTRDGMIQLAPRLYLQGLDRLHQYLATPADDQLLLIGRRHVRSNNSWMHNSQRLVKGKDRCTLMIHPKDASRAGLVDGDTALVATEAGEVRLTAEVTEGIMPGVVSIPHGWGHERAGIQLQVAQQHAGVSINDIIRDDQIDPLCGVSALNGQKVTVKVAKAMRSGTAKKRVAVG